MNIAIGLPARTDTPVIPSHISSSATDDLWQRLYYSELWIRTVYTYRSLRARQLAGPLTERQQAQFARLDEIVYEREGSHGQPSSRWFACSAGAKLRVPSFMALDSSVELIELCVCGARISGAPPDILHRQVTLSYKLEIFDGGDLSFPARVISTEAGQVQLAFIGAPMRNRLG